MPRIKATEVPTIARGGKESVYKEQMAELAELLSEDNFGAGEACQFDIPTKEVKAEDGTKSIRPNLDPLVTALRKVGKDAGRKIKTASNGTHLYVQDGGPWTEKAEDSENDSAKAVRKGAGAAAKK